MGTFEKARPRRRGGALLVAIIATIVLLGMSGAILALTGSSKQEQVSATETVKALYVAEAGLNLGIAALRADSAAVLANPAPVLGDAQNPIAFSGGTYWGTAVDNGGGTTVTLTAFGASQGEARGVEAVMTGSNDGIFTNALFAGNRDNDPNYSLGFGGVAGQADDINGNVYSGGAVSIVDDADVSGGIRATGTITGGSGEEGISLPIPDIAGMDYSTNHDFDVAAMFAADGYTPSSSAYKGSAQQVPESSPAHIFRKDPSDRAADINATPKADYFLEDPYESYMTSSTVHRDNGSRITVSGLGGEPGVNGNEKVYYIDGNLWVHNKGIFSFTMYNSGPEPVRVTFVVRGNIYYSDNVLYHDPDDAVAFIAIKDDNYPDDSGNIYFGDPTFGTLEQMDAFMYAENNFYDNNLSASGSATVTVNGNMTAGNQVLINRDSGDQHSKLTVNFDDRIASGGLTLPGLPGVGGAALSWTVASWREVPVQ